MLPAPCYVLSDAHLGAAPAETERDLLALLRRLPEDARSLVINGDLFDFWFEWRHAVPRAGVRVLGALARLRDEGIPVLWIAGNHDCWGGEVLTEELGVDYRMTAWRGSAGGWDAVIEHGDGLREKEDAPYRRPAHGPAAPALREAAVIFSLIPFIFKRPWVGILLWSWLGYMNPHRLAWGFAYDFPFSMIVALVTIMSFMASNEKKEMVWTRETIILLILVAWMLVTTTFFAFNPRWAWFQWDKVWKIQFMVFLTALVIKERQHLHWLIWVIALSLGFYGVKGGIFTILKGGVHRVQGPDGTFIGGNNEIALALVMVIPLIRYLHLQETRKWTTS